MHELELSIGVEPAVLDVGPRLRVHCEDLCQFVHHHRIHGRNYERRNPGRVGVSVGLLGNGLDSWPHAQNPGPAHTTQQRHQLGPIDLLPGRQRLPVKQRVFIDELTQTLEGASLVPNFRHRLPNARHPSRLSCLAVRKTRRQFAKIGRAQAQFQTRRASTLQVGGNISSGLTNLLRTCKPRARST